MTKLFAITAIGTLYSRKRVRLSRWGVERGVLSTMIHMGKRSFYFYPASNKRSPKVQSVFF